MKYRFYYEDTLEPVLWYDSPETPLGPYDDPYEAFRDLDQNRGVWPPDAVCYILMSEDQAAALRARLSPAT